MKPYNEQPPCNVTDDELVAFQDRDLSAGRLFELDRHVSTCPRCQTRLDESDILGSLIRNAAPTPSRQEIESGRAQLMARLREEQAAPSPTRPQRQRRTIPKAAWQVAVVALLLAGLTSYALVPRESWADFPLARAIGFTINEDLKDQAPASDPESGPLPADTNGALQSDGALQFEPVTPDALPGGFGLVSQTSAGQDAVELEYQNASGLTITVTQSVASESNTAIDRERYQLASVGEQQVLYLFNPSLGSVSHAIWTDNGLLFSLLVPVFSGMAALDLETLLRLCEGFTAATP